MAVTIKHAKTDTIADWTQADLDAQIALGNYPPGTLLADIVLPSDWNNNHTFSGTLPVANGGTGKTSFTDGQLLIGNTSTGGLDASTLTAGSGISITNNAGSILIANTGGGGGGISGVTASAPLASSGGSTPNITITQAGTSSNGYLSSTDWNTFNNKVSMVYPSTGIPYSTGTAWGTSYTTTGSGTIIALQTNPTLYNPNIDVIDFDTTYATTLTAGQLGWDGNNTLGLGMIGGNVVQHIGEDSFIYIKASSTITKGQVIMFTGAVGASAVPTGAPATGITDGTYIMGIAAESIATNGFGLVQTFGTLRNVNTTGYVDGDILWYNPSVTGGLTKTTPSAPNVKVQMAAVLNGGSSGGGSILVRVNAGSQLGGTDSNVQITSASNGQLLSYDGVAGYWKNTNLTAGTGISVSAAAGVVTVTNSAPDQTVVMSGTSPVSVTGTYPSFTVSMTQANTSTNGWLSSTDWNTFNNKQPAGTYVTSVSATSPVTSTGGTTPTIAMPAATTSVSGYLTSTDWNTFNNKGSGSVTSVSGTGTVSGISLSGTVTSSGSLTLGGSLDLSSPPTIGNTTPNTGSFTTLIGGGSSANYGQLTGGATTKAVEFKSLGTDTNISMAFQPKGTGAIDLAAGSSGVNISNGGTVTAITRTAVGSNYTTIPSVAITAPTTAGGVQATASTTMQYSNATVASGGTGYAVNDILTLVGGSGTTTVKVTAVSAGVVTTVTYNSGGGGYTSLPTNPVSTTGGTGTGCTLTVTWAIDTISIGTAGSGYIEQPTVSFSGGGGSGASAYATVGSGTIVKSIGSTMSFYTPAGEAVRIIDNGTTTVNYWQFQGRQTTGGILASAQGTDSNIAAFISSKGTGNVTLATNNFAQTQFNVSHTASAVNYVQVTGASTNNTPAISAQGSDANVNLLLNPKGTGQLNVFANGGSQFRVSNTANAVNYLQAIGNIASNAPAIQAQGSDTNIDLALTPKGTGKVTFTSTGASFAGSSSGTTTLIATAVAGTTTLTLPAATDTLVGRATTDTLTNKRITSRVSTTTSSATPTINTDNVDMYGLTAQTVDITSFTTNLSGTPTDGQKLWIYIVGTAARAITWGASFESSTVTLPTTTVSTNRLDVGFVWNAATSKWRCVATA